MPLPPRRTMGIMGTIVTSRTHTLYVFTWQRKQIKLRLGRAAQGKLKRRSFH
jgi:hypothetical protein